MNISLRCDHCNDNVELRISRRDHRNDNVAFCNTNNLFCFPKYNIDEIITMGNILAIVKGASIFTVMSIFMLVGGGYAADAARNMADTYKDGSYPDDVKEKYAKAHKYMANASIIAFVVGFVLIAVVVGFIIFTVVSGGQAARFAGGPLFMLLNTLVLIFGTLAAIYALMGVITYKRFISSAGITDDATSIFKKSGIAAGVLGAFTMFTIINYLWGFIQRKMAQSKQQSVSQE